MDEILNAGPDMDRYQGLLPKVVCELDRYRENYRFLLILTCSFAELMVGALIEEKCKNGKAINNNSRDFPFSVRLTMLNEMGHIHDIHFEWLNWLRKQRNDAAHKPDFHFTSDRMPAWAGEKHKTADKLFSLCVNILGIFWNQNVQLYRTKLPIDA